MEGARRKWDEEVYNSSNNKQKGIQPTFIFKLTIEFSGLIEKMLFLVAVYLVVLKTTINTAMQCHCFIHYSECNDSM